MIIIDCESPNPNPTKSKSLDSTLPLTWSSTNLWASTSRTISCAPGQVIAGTMGSWDSLWNSNLQGKSQALRYKTTGRVAVWPCGQAFGLRHIMLPVLCRVAYRFSLWIQLAPSLSSCQVQPQVPHCPDKSPWKTHSILPGLRHHFLKRVCLKIVYPDFMD